MGHSMRACAGCAQQIPQREWLWLFAQVILGEGAIVWDALKTQMRVSRSDRIMLEAGDGALRREV